MSHTTTCPSPPDDVLISGCGAPLLPANVWLEGKWVGHIGSKKPRTDHLAAIWPYIAETFTIDTTNNNHKTRWTRFGKRRQKKRRRGMTRTNERDTTVVIVTGSERPRKTAEHG